MAGKPAAPNPNNPDAAIALVLSKEQLAEMLHVSVATLLRWHHAGIGPPRIKCGRAIYYSAQGVEDWRRLNDARELRRRSS